MVSLKVGTGVGLKSGGPHFRAVATQVTSAHFNSALHIRFRTLHCITLAHSTTSVNDSIMFTRNIIMFDVLSFLFLLNTLSLPDTIFVNLNSLVESPDVNSRNIKAIYLEELIYV